MIDKITDEHGNTKTFACCHTHSLFSDGEYTPEQLVKKAHGLGMGGFIVTDHYTVKGYYHANKAA